jgi:mRNA interferase MazF
MIGLKFNPNFKDMVNKIEQGKIYLADLNPIKGHEQGGIRPVLVVQNDVLNKHLGTVVVAPITKNLRAKGLMTTYFLSKSVSKLKLDSVVLLFQIRTVDKIRLKRLVSGLNHQQLAQVREQLSLIF